MKLSGETIIEAARADVWAALMDSDVLARAIDGVETLERVPEDEGEAARFEGAMNAKVGPVRARFTGQVAITEANPPQRYVIRGEGKGGVAGFAKGSAAVELEETGPGGPTKLSYAADSQVGGKLAQLGARLVEGAAKGYAERFFQNFKTIVENGAGSSTGAVPMAAEAARPVESASARTSARPDVVQANGPSGPAAAPPPGAAQAAHEPTIGAVDEHEPFRSGTSGLGPVGWGLIVIAFVAAIVIAQLV